MKDRVRIMLGSREIVKRYIGDRLVWESVVDLSKFRVVVMENIECEIYGLWVRFYGTDTNKVGWRSNFKYIQIQNEEPLNITGAYEKTSIGGKFLNFEESNQLFLNYAQKYNRKYNLTVKLYY